ncbi:MAG: hypothetical protein PHV36_12760 [Elusimicrobiales bacterium]|nr:hypothetical protein [Elusimicrobiales bacterium]
MQDPKSEKNEVGAGFEKAVEPIHGIIDRIHALHHPDWEQKNEDISSIKAALARYSSDLEHLKYRYDARGAELEKLKAQYMELEHKFLMRPDAMRRAGEMEVTELVKQKHDLVALENSLERDRHELGREKERLAARAEGTVSARQAELEKEYAAKAALLASRDEKCALREKGVAEAEKHFKEQVEEARRATAEELSASFEHERAAFRKEKTILAADLEKWRVRAEELLSQQALARKAAEDLESAAENAKEAAAEARQKCKLAEMEKDALAGESGKWKLKAEESLAQLAQARTAAAGLESALESSKEAAAEARQKTRLAEMEKAALLERLEEWDAKGPEFDKWRSELSAREEACRRLEEQARAEAQPLRERIAALEDGLRQEKREAEKWRLKSEESLSRSAGSKQAAEDLESQKEALNEAAAEARQRTKMAEMERTAALKRLEEWEKKGPELEKWRSELAAREENCKRIEENAGKEAQPLRDRIAALEILARENEKLAAQAKSRYAIEIPEFEEKFKLESARAASLKEELKGAREHLDKVLKDCAALEEELVLAREKHLKTETEKDAERSKKMESQLAEIEQKEKEMEEAWTRRHKALEAEQKGYHAEFEKRQLAILEDLRANSAGIDKLYAQKEAKLVELNKRLIDEFQDREAKARTVEEELRGQAANLAASAGELARDYEAKRSELEGLKRKLLAEIAGQKPQN